MDILFAAIDQLFERVGDLWFIALIGAFFVMVCESAKPKPAEGERAKEPEGFALLVMILSLLTPLLLLIQAAFSGAGDPIAVIAVIGAAIVSAGLIGWIIGLVSTDFGRTLNRAAPFLAVGVFALTLYVSWRTVFDLINGFIAR